jgi:sugar lactone lactonase YvrE
MQRLRRVLLGGAAAVLAVPLGIGSAVADDDDHGHHGPGVDDVDVVAEGLDSPRGLAVDRHENLWIAQAGRGGDGPCFAGPEGPACLGDTGKISVLEEDEDHVVDVVTGLASVAPQGGHNAVGPSDVAFDGRRLLATIGLGANPGVRTTPAPDGLGGSELASMLGTVQRVHARTGEVSLVADIGGHELAENPEDEDLDTNPNSLAVRGNRTVVADAGGNALLRVRRAGDVETVFVFPHEAPVQIPGAPPGAMIEADPVPNSVVVGPDGAFYVGQLTGFPFTAGAATVWRLERGEAPTVYADGFTNIMDLAFTEDGDLLVLEIAHNSLLSGDLTGALIRVDRHDPSTHVVLLEEPLLAPGGMAVDDDDVYISNQSVAPGEGQILKVELDD